MRGGGWNMPETSTRIVKMIPDTTVLLIIRQLLVFAKCNGLSVSDLLAETKGPPNIDGYAAVVDGLFWKKMKGEL